MQFSINARSLALAVRRVTTILDEKFFSGLLLETKGDHLSVSCVAPGCVMRERVAIEESKSDEAITVAASFLKPVLTNETDKLHFSGTPQQIVIDGTDAQYQIGTMPGRPYIFSEKATASITVQSQALGRSFRLAGLTDSIEAYSSFVMNRVCLEVDGDHLVVWSMDPTRLVTASCPILQKQGEIDKLILPDYNCAYAVSIFPDKEKESAPVTISLAEDQTVIFATENRYFSARQEMGKLPDPKQFVRLHSPYEFTFKTQDLLTCLNKMVVAGTGKQDSCKIVWEDGRLNFSSASSFKAVKAWMKHEDTGMRKEHFVNAKRVSEFLSRTSAEEATLGFDDKARMVTVKCQHGLTMIAEMTR